MYIIYHFPSDATSSFLEMKGAGPLTSNLPSENRMMNIGSKRLEGTGRTAGVKLKKLKEKMGEKGTNVRKYLGTSTGSDDLTFLKNALGQQIAFEVEKGGGARANLLATGGRSHEKLLDAAAVRVGVELDVVTSLAIRHKRKRQEEESKDEAAKKKKAEQYETLSFLKNNIGRNDDVGGIREDYENQDNQDDSDDDDACLVVDAEDDWAEMKEDERRATFLAFYKKEKARLKVVSGDEASNGTEITQDEYNDDFPGVNWEDC